LLIIYIRHFKLAKVKSNDNRKSRKDSIDPIKKGVNRKLEDIDLTKKRSKVKKESKKTKGERVFVLAPGY
jgi:hypothetical protein